MKSVSHRKPQRPLTGSKAALCGGRSGHADFWSGATASLPRGCRRSTLCRRLVQQSRRGADPPRGELEIITPGVDWPPTLRSRVSNSASQVTFVRIARLGPVGIILAFIVLGMLAPLTVVLLLGLARVGVALAGAVIINAAISVFSRRTFPR